MDTAAKNNKRTVIGEIIFIGALLAFIVLSFISFIRDNNERILEQNNSFIEAATNQTKARIDDLFDTAQSNVEMMTHLYGSMMTKPVVDEALLQDMTDRSTFDYVEFISADGIDLTASGQTADLSDRDYFIQGMQGKSGKTVIYNSKITHETLLIFYSPFYYEGEIIGVLSGIMRGETIHNVLDTDYFGTEISTYLLERNGNVILSHGDNSNPENLLTSLTANNQLAPQDLQAFQDVLDDTNNIDFNNFNYKGFSGAGSAYITALSDGEWLLVQNFPSSLTKQMTEQADSAGIWLEVKLFAVFLIYILYLLMKNWQQKRQLTSENQEISRIVGAVTHLFSRFALVDFENDTYEYLKDKTKGAPEKGAYAELIKYLTPKYLSDNGNGEKMSDVISREYVQKHLTEDVPYLQFEYQIDMDGTCWENISILCLKRKNGLPSRVLFAIQDITSLKEQELQIRAALQNASEAAEAANRAKSDFLARMSHDIRTPMNAIMGMTAVAAMHMDDPERLTDCLSKITISSRHLLALINDVLDMSKIESGKVTLSEEPFNMADMVESLLTIIQAQVNSRHQQLKVHISDITHEDVIGDTLRLRQIFVNILGNAVKFTPVGGTIIFSIRECVSQIADMACYEFICEDTGIGMDEAFIKTIFDPFARSQNSVSQNIEGTGLGMTITRNILLMMDGDINVESQLGVGSKFTVRLHLRLQEPGADNVDELADLHVLVADDDPDCCVSTCDILESIGMTAEWVLTGDEAVQRTMDAYKAGNDFSAVILDWKMPGKDGLETAREIRSKVGDHVPIIILSAYDWSDIEAEAREAGIQAFIEKPLFRSRLIYALKSVLNQDNKEKKLAASELEQADFSGKRVLLVEDNELNREIAVELLSHIGVAVEQAEDGQIAVNMVKNNPPGYYNLIFMDIQMPVMDGYEASRRIRNIGREDTAHIPIVAMSANAFDDDIRDAQDAGMNDHVAKPVEVPKLLEALEKWL